ncbi:MAG: aldo/keto reductase [Firmicutes bacterium]|jgi:predicted aldo/keto reductase-like oxidoreductase|nr:aldo/keto reductase [Bacillota bacterium]
MKRRQFGQCGFEVSVLGFGCMRLPVVAGDPDSIDEDEAVRMIRYAIDHGVDYLDTAYNYHRGKSEGLVGRALGGGYRQQVRVATKLPTWLCKTSDDFTRYLDEQLDRLETDRIDCYLLHSLNKSIWERLRGLGVRKFLDRELSRGRIGFAGFSFHDTFDLFKSVVDSYDWSLCQIMLNYVDVECQAGVRGLEYASSRGLAVVVMEPLRGGKLASGLPAEVKAEMEQIRTDWSPAEWGLRWVLNRPEVSVVLSGMSTMGQVVENLRIASEAEPGSMTADELAALAKARQIFQGRVKIGCTECGYCMPCPNELPIPDLFTLYNDAFVFNASRDSARIYELISKSGKDASACVACGNCERACPQHLPVVELLKEVHKALGEARQL